MMSLRGACRLVLLYMHVISFSMLFLEQNGWTPLMQAGQDGDVEMVKTLIAAGANLDHQSKVTSLTLRAF